MADESPNADEKICFVVSPIGRDRSETRRKADKALRTIIKPAVEPRGYKVVRADEIDEPGIITSQVLVHILTDALVVADLTEQNPNVFYELAIRHVARKPVIHIAMQGEEIPFDVKMSRLVRYDFDIEGGPRAREEIAKQVLAIESKEGEFDTPLSVAVDMKGLSESAKPLETVTARTLEIVDEVRRRVNRIERAIVPQPELGLGFDHPMSEAAQRYYKAIAGRDKPAFDLPPALISILMAGQQKNTPEAARPGDEENKPGLPDASGSGPEKHA